MEVADRIIELEAKLNDFSAPIRAHALADLMMLVPAG